MKTSRWKLPPSPLRPQALPALSTPPPALGPSGLWPGLTFPKPRLSMSPAPQPCLPDAPPGTRLYSGPAAPFLLPRVL